MVITSFGEYINHKENKSYSLAYNDSENEVVVLLGENGQTVSGFKKDKNTGNMLCYNNKMAKGIYDKIQVGMSKCSPKNCTPMPFALGVCERYITNVRKTDFTIEKFNKLLCGAAITSEDDTIDIVFNQNVVQVPSYIEWVPISSPTRTVGGKELTEEFGSDTLEENIPVRTLAEIGLEKDITWLKNKKYYVVNDDEEADQIISYIEEYVKKTNGPVAYDVETSGLFINMFGKIGSSQKEYIDKLNAELAAEGKPGYRVDTLTGFILTIQPDVSYYFPVRNRKFANVFSKADSEKRKKIVQNIKAAYTIGEYKDRDDDMARWVRNHSEEEFTSDIILMERCRWLLTHANIVAHNGIFEWKTTWLYNIDLNLCDDTMVLHKLLYKFNDMTRGNLGERSDLKYLTNKHFGVDQLELTDFFTDYKEDDSGLVSANSKRKKGKKSGVKIDFSYMDYEGTKAYAPADGDFTLQLFNIFKKDLIENHSNMEYIYQVEMIVSCAIAYMEFYGHRIDKKKIESTKIEQQISKLLYEAQFRKEINYSDEEEEYLADELKDIIAAIDRLKSNKTSPTYEQELKVLEEERAEAANKLDEHIRNSENIINLASPQQLIDLFYHKLKIMSVKLGSDAKESVGKKVIKEYSQMKNEDGSVKYPMLNTYRKWKDLDTLLSKFFDNLPDYMYPGGFIFSTFGQISTATGRMSCSKPNCQQYPKSISSIVIPRENCVMIDADFSQIEYRTLVALAHEDHLIEKFSDPDMDYHTTMASLMYGVPYAMVTPKMRGDAKSFNFGIPYGMGFASLAKLLTGNSSKKSVEEAKEKYELYFKDQPNVRQFFIDVKQKAKFNEYTETKWHRIRKYNFLDKDGKYSQKMEAQALRQAGNAIIQGCLDGNTLIHTKEYGTLKIKEAAGERLHIWDGKDWTLGDVTFSGPKKKCIITFSTGQKFICSPIHKFLTSSGEFVECKNLTNKHKVVISNEIGVNDSHFGDGHLKNVGSAIASVAIDNKNYIENDNGIPDIIFRDKYLLKGFLHDILNFKLNYGVMNIAIDGEKNKRDIQKALLEFGVVSSITKDGLRVGKKFSNRLLNSIYYHSYEDKADKTSTIGVKSVNITDEYIDMYDVCNTSGGYYMADGIITHNTAADIFKIAAARTFLFIRRNNLFGKFYITNMVHDEQLTECDVSVLNTKVVLKNLVEAMELHIDGFPPLFVGAGVGDAWAHAKGKMAEIHPLLAEQFIEEAKHEKLFLDKPQTPKEVLDYFDGRVFEFRKQKVTDYILDKSNWGKPVYPVIGNLLSLQFDNGVTKEFTSKYTAENGYTKEEIDSGLKGIVPEQIHRFIDKYGLDVDWHEFAVGTELENEEEADVEYDDAEEFDEDGYPIEVEDSTYELVDEDDKVFGIDYRDIISEYGILVSPKLGICGIKVSNLSARVKDDFTRYLTECVCDKDDNHSMQVVYLKDNNILLETGIYVRGVTSKRLNSILGIK